MTLGPLSSLFRTSVASDHFSTTILHPELLCPNRDVRGRGRTLPYLEFPLEAHTWAPSQSKACGFLQSALQYLQAINSVNCCLCETVLLHEKRERGFVPVFLQHRTGQSGCMSTQSQGHSDCKHMFPLNFFINRKLHVKPGPAFTPVDMNKHSQA